MSLIAVLGPTASGKSSLAMKLAKKLDGEIISCDSMQVYKGMDIGTAKPTLEDQQEIPHHLIDNLDISVRYSASMFLELANKIIPEVKSRGKVPIIAGGTGMYARLLLYGGDMMPADREVNAALKSRLINEGHDALWQELLEKDPVAAEKVKGNDRRLLRSLEVFELTGEPLPGKTTWGDEQIVDGLQIINMCPTEYNRERVGIRAAEMLKNGWIEETEALIDKGLWETPTAYQSLGYRQIGDYLEGKFESFEALQEKITTLTRRYAKRQRTWFRNQHPGSHMINREPGDSSEAIADDIVKLYEEKFS
ncbi:MAG: tRNA (adenosine(37)-N6)-dimethylallyltransferase MiaA [Lentisphaeraceae bacterium]|nr:tRNA (adenosine(37)-N6)-dimethylallyltransferase MiaA [Lentisphaeraceae bacterium]